MVWFVRIRALLHPDSGHARLPNCLVRAVSPQATTTAHAYTCMHMYVSVAHRHAIPRNDVVGSFRLARAHAGDRERVRAGVPVLHARAVGVGPDPDGGAQAHKRLASRSRERVDDVVAEARVVHGKSEAAYGCG